MLCSHTPAMKWSLKIQRLMAGLVRKLDFSIFEECCRMLEEWKDTDLGGLKLSCNFTRLTMSDNAFARRMNEILEGTSFDRSRLVVELTEDSLADNMSVSIRNIAYCKELGFSTLGLGHITP